MAGPTNNEILKNMAVDIAIIKQAIAPLPDMFKDIYIGNGDPPMRDTCREYVAEKKAKETARTVTANNRLDFSNKVKLQIIGGLIAVCGVQIGLVLAAINWIPKLFPALAK